ncbi:LPS translocon maturation chaperone LptM [Saliniradius amylolyticus]|uniref:LPS translocon maturation chaperone LptM n=1 Tax=Saliniradius amylolyticus TaxID=2183582 RepID=UPI001EF5BD22|nr:lipoprotein [Saliniradius amylolyticus]
MKRLRRLNFLWLLLLTACGQKGPLFLPEDAESNQAEPTEAASPAPAQQSKPEEDN